MKFFRFTASRTSFLAFGFFLAVGITTVFATWTPSPKNPLDPLYANDWNVISHNASSWEREGTLSAPGSNVFLNTSGGVGIGTTTLSADLTLDVEGKVGATEYCDENGTNCIAPNAIPRETIFTTTCGANQVLKYNGTDWTCAEDSDITRTITCGANQILKYDGTTWICAEDNQGTGIGGNIGVIEGGGLEMQNGLVGIIKFPCAENSVMKFQNNNWVCAPDATGTGGATQTIYDISCGTNEILKYGAGGWVCAVDENNGTGTTYWNSTTGGIAYTGGNIGIGTTAPNAELDIYSADSAASIRLANSNNSILSDWELQSATTGSDEKFSIYNIGTNKSYFEILKDGSISVAPTTSFNIDGDINIGTGHDICVIGGNCLSSGTSGSGGGTGSLWTESGSDVYRPSGKVGIGTPSPAAELEVYGSDGTTAIRISEEEAGQSPSTWEIQAVQVSGDDSFSIRNVEFNQNYITILKSGKIGILEDAPSQALHVGGNVQADSYLYNSDIRLKNNIHTTKGLETILNLRGVDFQWIKNGEQGLGFVAQEVEKTLPQIVKTDAQGYKSVNYAAITASLVEAVKEQQKEIEVLKKEVEKLQK